ncbi:hypothetical protein KY290_033279 [Solanum tuberosum]|uniref:Uncharacterized protein n=1 Tax=Solanum tuberosum TaxID=4113 RepID=A0ABQ7U1L7_SOLTU|nr:hypothetical protein KY289_032654 [Solanum tuberosum]KAH0647294.1 hypothetical protein KY285_032542 [Solanum tuberosum]KAH0740236.1 hypothetical protein KY290_033279 [Solanum tuberosum]
MAYYNEEEAWKCPKHPSKKRRTTTGVCSICLRDRLSELCPICAKVRQPCSSNCAASTTSLSSSSGKINGEEPAAFYRSKSVGIPFLKSRNVNSSSRRNQAECENCSKIGDGGQMELCRSKSVGIPFLKSRNIDSGDRRKTTENEKSNKTGEEDGSSETALCRSKSVGIPFLKSRNVDSGDRRRKTESEKSNKTASFWWMFKLRKRGKENESESKAYYCNDTRIKEFAITTVMRSRSVNVAVTSVSGGNDVNCSPEKLKGWYLVSPMKVFRQSSRAPKLVS